MHQKPEFKYRWYEYFFNHCPDFHHYFPGTLCKTPGVLYTGIFKSGEPAGILYCHPGHDFQFDFKGSNGLYNLFHRKEIELLEKSELVTLDFMLNDFDIATLDIRRPIRVYTNYYYINSIEGYNIAKVEQTTVSLIKINS